MVLLTQLIAPAMGPPSTYLPQVHRAYLLPQRLKIARFERFSDVHLGRDRTHGVPKWVPWWPSGMTNATRALRIIAPHMLRRVLQNLWSFEFWIQWPWVVVFLFQKSSTQKFNSSSVTLWPRFWKRPSLVFECNVQTRVFLTSFFALECWIFGPLPCPCPEGVEWGFNSRLNQSKLVVNCAHLNLLEAALRAVIMQFAAQLERIPSRMPISTLLNEHIYFN